MDSSICDPERINTALWIMSKYSGYIEKDDTIVFRQDGDPCNTYKGVRPKGRVTSVEREEDGFVQLKGILDNGEEFVSDNQSIHPSKIWDVSSETGEAIYKRVHGKNEGEDKEDELSAYTHSDEGEEITYGDSLSVGSAEKMEALVQRISDVELSLAKAVKELSEDIIRGAVGKPLEFAYRFAEKYTEMESSSAADEEEYQGSNYEGEHQREKDTFSEDEKEEAQNKGVGKKAVTPVSYSNTNGQYAVYADTEVTQ